MVLSSFSQYEFDTVSEALDVSEDATGNFYKFSADQWKKHRYDVKTLPSLCRNEISQHAFAMLSKGCGLVDGFELKTRVHDFYFICLQDHQILRALSRDKQLGLLPLLVYIFTHELVHIVRFCNFLQRFDLPPKEIEQEEGVVHATTFKILEDSSMPDLGYVLESYQGHRICDMSFS